MHNWLKKKRGSASSQIFFTNEQFERFERLQKRRPTIFFFPPFFKSYNFIQFLVTYCNLRENKECQVIEKMDISDFSHLTLLSLHFPMHFERKLLGKKSISFGDQK